MEALSQYSDPEDEDEEEPSERTENKEEEEEEEEEEEKVVQKTTAEGPEESTAEGELVLNRINTINNYNNISCKIYAILYLKNIYYLFNSIFLLKF